MMRFSYYVQQAETFTTHVKIDLVMCIRTQRFNYCDIINQINLKARSELTLINSRPVSFEDVSQCHLLSSTYFLNPTLLSVDLDLTAYHKWLVISESEALILIRIPSPQAVCLVDVMNKNVRGPPINLVSRSGDLQTTV